MRYTVLLPTQTASSGDIFQVAAWRKEIGEMVGEGEPLVALRAGEIEIVFFSPAFGVLVKKIALTGAAIETGEPIAVLSGVPDSLLHAARTPPAAFSARPPYVPGGPEDLLLLSPREQAVAAHQSRALRSTPHVSMAARVDVTETTRLAARLAVETVFPLVLCAVAAALQKFPALNAERAGDTAIRRKRYVHIGFPVFDTETNALVAVPVVREADKKSVRAVVEEWHTLCRDARAKTLSFEAQRGATFTLSQAAPGADCQTPIIALPQAAALCVGAVSRVPTVVGEAEERIEIRSVLHLCLSYDVRVVEDQTAGAFLDSARANLEETRFVFAG